MSIGVEGQFIFDIRTETGEDIVKYGELKSFTAIESCTLLLPAFRLTITLQDLASISYFNEGAILKVALAKVKEDLKYIDLQILKYEDMGIQDGKALTLTCTLYKPTYSKQTRSRVFSNKTSIEVLKTVLETYFDVESNIKLTSDRKSWAQTGISDKSFVDKVWQNSYLDSGFLALGCCALDDKYVVKDIIKMFAEQKYDYKVSTQIEDPEKDIVISGPVVTSAEFGFYNSGFANDKILLNFNPVTEEFINKSVTIDALLSTSDKISKNKKTGKDVERIKNFDNDFSFKSRKYNILALTNYSKFTLEVSSQGMFHPVKLLDKVFLDVKDVDMESREFWSGNYIVTKVIRNIQDNKFSTLIRISRESSGSNKGEDL